MTDICEHWVFSSELTLGVLLVRGMDIRPSSDTLGLSHQDQTWLQLQLKDQSHSDLVPRRLSQAFLSQRPSPLLLRQENGLFSILVLIKDKTVP